jgi:hypothetical protein
VRIALPCLALLALAGCQPEPVCDGRSLRIIEPDQGEMVPEGRVNVVVEACDLEEDEQIRLRLTMPVESDYGFEIIEDPNQRLYGFDVPTLPGTMELVADVVDDPAVVSEPRSFEVVAAED